MATLQEEWVQNALGVSADKISLGGNNGDPATPPEAPPPEAQAPPPEAPAGPPEPLASSEPPTQTADASVPTAPPADAASSTSNITSDASKRGYQDGVNGADANPGPLSPDALTGYQEGYAKGHYEYTQQNAAPQQSQSAPSDDSTTPAGPPPPPAQAASGPDSNEYKRGYQDGVNGGDANPGPLVDDALTDYQEGYAKGHDEFSSKNSSQAPAQPNEANSSDGPPISPAPPPEADPGANQTVPTDGDRAAYLKGYEDGLRGAKSNPIGQVGFQYARDYTSGYDAGKADARNVPTAPAPNPDGLISKDYFIKQIEDLGGPCYDPDKMSYDDLQRIYQELKQKKEEGGSGDDGPKLEQGRTEEESAEDRKRMEDAEEQRREFLRELKIEIPEEEKEKGEGPEETPEPLEMPAAD